MTRYLLDTNTVSQLLRKHPEVLARVLNTPMSALCISAITEGELLFGLAKRPEARALHSAVHEFLRRVDVLPWRSDTARAYGPLRADAQKQGKALGALDMLIAAHAVETGSVLVSNDQAFAQLKNLRIEDWTRPGPNTP